MIPLYVRTLLWTECAFNLAFYLVVPFLAVRMTEDLGFGMATVGLVLGIRTFSQQGLFFLGGGLADTFGARPLIIIGSYIRALGFLLTATQTSLSGFILGVVFIGFAAALFSPAVESAVAIEGKKLEDQGVITRSALFAREIFWSRLGMLIGPIAGTLLLPFSFELVSAVGAIIFILIALAHTLLLPPRLSTRIADAENNCGERTESVLGQSKERKQNPELFPMLRSMCQDWVGVMSNKVFILFALFYSTNLLAYTMQYLALPVELERATGSAESLGWFFTVEAILVVSLQIPLNRGARRLGAQWSILGGFILMALGFGIVAACAPYTQEGWYSYVPATFFVILLTTGAMVAVPDARDMVGKIAQEKSLGSYFGFLQSFGGVAVLIGSTLIGSMLSPSSVPQVEASYPWWVMCAVMLVATAGLRIVMGVVEKK